MMFRASSEDQGVPARFNGSLHHCESVTLNFYNNNTNNIPASIAHIKHNSIHNTDKNDIAKPVFEKMMRYV